MVLVQGRGARDRIAVWCHRDEAAVVWPVAGRNKMLQPSRDRPQRNGWPSCRGRLNIVVRFHSDMTHQIERLRNRYRPADVRLLFVGESAPASGQFFYRGQTAITRYTCQAFERAFSRRFVDDDEFLAFFQLSGCWLDDVSHVPVDRLAPRDRNAVIRDALEDFSARLRSCSPTEIVVVLRRILPVVRRAADQAGVNAVVHPLPFPGFHWQGDFEDGLVSVLRRARRRGLFTMSSET